MKMALILAMFATAVTIIATVLVLAAFGLGKALSLVLPLSAFEASLLSMLALSTASLAVWRFVAFGLSNYGIGEAGTDEENEDDEDDEVDEEDFDIEPDERKGVAWAAPIQVISPRPVGRNSPCPCGSGTKYKRCCGKDDPPPRQVVRQ